MKMKKVLSLLLVAAMSFSLVACGNNEDEGKKDSNASSENPTENTEETAPVELTEDADQYYNTYMASDPTSLDVSLRSDSYSSTIISNVMEGLIRLEEIDGRYVVSAGDAQTWEANEAGTVWTFHLGDNKWSDGEAVTADQYVYSLQRSANPETGCPNSFFLETLKNYSAISKGEMEISELGVKALDEKTVEITLEKPHPAFLEMCNGSIYYPQRQDIIEANGDQYGSEADKTIYNGPYVLESWTHNSKLVLKKNPNYWNAENVKMETVNISILADTATVENSYKSGDLDMLGVSSQEAKMAFHADDSSKYEYSVNSSVTFNFYNTKDVLFKNAKIRKAFSLAIDHEDINEMCFGGLRVPVWGWVAPNISVGETNFREASGDIMLNQYQELIESGKTAKDLLLEGMAEEGLGDDPSTLDVTLSLAGTNDWFKTYGEYLQEVYSTELGVTLKIDFSDWGIFSSNLQSGDYQMGYMSWGAYYNDPYDVLSVFNSEYDQVGTGWVNEEFNTLIKEAGSEMDEQVRLEKFKQAEKLLFDEAVVCPLAAGTSHSFYKDYVYGYSTLSFSSNGYKDMYTKGRK